MKNIGKITVMFLIGLLTAPFLFAPTTVSAAACSNNCVAVMDCTCGSRIVVSGDWHYCYNGTAYPLTPTGKSQCDKAMSGQGVTQIRIPEASFDSPSTFLDVANNIGKWIFTALLVLAGIFMVVAGYYFVIGGGEPQTLNKARQMLINALIGVALAIASQGFIQVVKTLVNPGS